MKYDPKDAVTTIPEGLYVGELVKVEDKTSKSGNPMQVLYWRLLLAEGKQFTVRDWILSSGASLCRYRELADAIGHKNEFEAGTFDASEHLGATVSVKIGLEVTVDWGDQNRVLGYRSSDYAGPAISSIPEKIDNDIPF